MKYLTASDKETIQLGRKLGAILAAGDVVALSGKLGSGKTWFTKGLALGLDVDEREVITSPSFSLVNEYMGRCPLYHMDLYRLDNLNDMLSIGLEEYFNDESVAVVEWADRCLELIPQNRIDIKIDILDGNNRSITISSNNPLISQMIK